MDLKDILQIDFKSLEDDGKQTVFGVISTIEPESIPKKHVKKVFEIAQDVLKFKGEEVESLRSRTPKFSSEFNDEDLRRLREENSKLKRTINKLDSDKAALKTRIRDLTEDMSSLRKRLQESNTSDKDDSSDLLSDLDRKEELLKNINAKNKHIKRLLRDIETLEKNTIEQTKVISIQEEKLSSLEFELVQIKDKLAIVNDDNQNLNDLLTKANEEIENLEKIVEQQETDREKLDTEFKMFIGKLEEKAYAWRKILDDKEHQLESIRKKYEELYLKKPKEKVEPGQETEVHRLIEAMQERDILIEELEDKLRIMAEEMMSSTKLMNQISEERELAENKVPHRNRQCCQELESALEHANKRCKELSEMLDSIEEDNTIKSKQTADALATLQAYEKGKDGLPQSLQKIGHLQQKLNSRDKQIKALIMEINSLHEIAQENSVLRKKLNIPEDTIILTSNLTAKQKSKDKIIDRLTLKLRASEEMRLNLKLEMNELRKELKNLRSSSQDPNSKTTSETVVASQSQGIEERQIQNDPIHCANCLKIMKKLPDKDGIIQEINNEWEAKYSGVIEENENLRVGMHEILEKIREYDASSDHISIDCTILEKLLHALDARSISGWYHPAMRMQNELIALKEREQALKEQINIVERATIVKQDSIEKPVIEEANIADTEANVDIVAPEKETEHLVSDQTQSLYPIIVQKDLQYDSLREKFLDVSQKYRETSLEIEKLRCFEALYEDLKSKLEASDNQITQYCAVLADKLSTVETKLSVCEKKYNFMKEDYERIVQEYKNFQLSNAAVIAELKNQIISKGVSELDPEESKHFGNKELADIETFKKECVTLKLQLAYITKHILLDTTELTNIEKSVAPFVQYGIIEDDFNLDYITSQEYNQLKSERDNLERHVQESTKQYRQLEKLLAVADEQIKSQQRQLTDLTDNQVNLRHLVADLQSNNEEKFIISKAYRDIEIAREEISKIKMEKLELENRYNELRSQLKDVEELKDSLEKKKQMAQTNDSIKLQFLKKSLFKLQENYCKFTPLVLLSDFLNVYADCISKSNKDAENAKCFQIITEDIISKVKIDPSLSETDNLLKAIKYEAKCRFLEEQVTTLNDKIHQSEKELESLRLSAASDAEHWKTINALFAEPSDNKPIILEDKMTQCGADKTDASANTDTIEEPKDAAVKKDALDVKSSDDTVLSCPSSPSLQASNIIAVRSLESQLKQAMHLASMRNALLLEAENKLAESQGRIKEMEKLIEEKNALLKQEVGKATTADNISYPRRSSLVESTITSLQTLLTEKDTTLNHYQELLKTEREQHTKSCEGYEKELELLQKKSNELEVKFKSKLSEITELQSKLDMAERRTSVAAHLNAEDEIKQLEDCDNNFNEISDEKIEEMFLDDNKQLSQELLQGSLNFEENGEHMNRYIQQLQAQLRDLADREKLWEESAKAKEDEIEILKEKLALLEEREKLEAKASPEIEQLQALLEEKDKHINDLMETLSSFHDDQQRFINETSLYSADQVAQLGADLTRSEATNRILSTQLEALRRQVANLTQREKQARELVNSLRNQLIKRPVVSVKSELNTRTKFEQLQKRSQLMETELEDLRKEKKRLTILVEEKRAKNANDLALWDKQKRWQQNAEKLKTKLAETEASLEKSRIMLNAAKTTINRLEKDKNALEARLRGAPPNKCCRTPSCPNLLLTKYCPSETPETCTTGSECNSPTHRDNSHKIKYVDVSDSNTDIINALKSRIESQQRRIVALELERKGSNALASELEKCQEKLAAVEAQNIRLEAKNLQLQLDIDLLRQGDEKERFQKRIKYLEDYVLALKEELAQAEAQKEISGADGKSGSGSLSHPEQTILSLRRIVERLRVENKNLKEARSCFDFKRDTKAGGDLVMELQEVKEKLRQKTQLLEKAKILLTRAAAKEKNLKEQLTIWKRKCSELQNVPVIDEISE